ncbi:MAG: FG-GAP repeat protein [Deltaproteobacteria bacterium]|nr:FG-GAP repeat protein [Deltaproteobacteria bacterium]
MTCFRVALYGVLVGALACSLEHPSAVPDASTDMTAPDLPDVDADTGPSCGLLDQPCCGGDSGRGMCASGLQCQASRCVREVICPPGQMNCAGRCATLGTDVSNCGMCGRQCPTGANGAAACVLGECQLQCNPGFGNCNGNTADGCESNLQVDPSNCMRCGVVCSAPGASVLRCEAGACVIGACLPNRGDCDMALGNGCETTLGTSVMHCGRCGMACAGGANATAVCEDGACGIDCAAGFADCDGNTANGCEVNTNTDATHCGGCRRACPPVAGGAPMCSMGRCNSMCAADFDDCDRDTRNGCEADLRTTVAHCGRCGNACAFANAVPACAARACQLMSCMAGFQNCNAMNADGCEVNTLTDVRNCGRCGTVCPGVTNGRPTCVSGTCGLSCMPGFALVGDTCVRSTPPRLLAPLSTAMVTITQPTLRWERGTTSSTGARIELCRTRDCASVAQTIDASGSSVAVPLALAPGVWFWRAFDRVGGTMSMDPSAVWEFRVPPRIIATTPRDLSYGSNADYNGDGLGDVVASGNTGNGVAQVFYGSATGTPTAGPRLTGAAGSGYGQSVANAGDLNGDGFGDLAVGHGTATQVSVYYGNRTGFSTPVALTGPAGFGFSVSGLGDVNNDGYADLAVGAPNSAQAFIYFGGSMGVSTTASQTLAPPAPAGTMYGQSVVGVGDVDGDGAEDLVVGAPSAPGGAAPTAYFYRGGTPAGVMPVASATLTGTASTLYFGNNVAGAVDYNGDGLADFAVSSYQGRVVRVYGSVGGVITQLREVSSPSTPAIPVGFGQGLSMAWDLNGDGFGDLIVGNNSNNPVNVYLGSMTSTAGAAIALAVPAGAMGFGLATGCGGDINGDGLSDLGVGDYITSRVYLYRGVTAPTAGPLVLGAPVPLDGPTGGRLGLWVASLGPFERRSSRGFL